MTMEPVWAGGFAVALGGERVGGRLLAGVLLIVVAMLLAELGPRTARTDRPETAALPVGEGLPC